MASFAGRFLEQCELGLSVLTVSLNLIGRLGTPGSTGNRGCYKTKFETVNCWPLKAAGKAVPSAICNRRPNGGFLIL